jgi:hypothetical protein
MHSQVYVVGNWNMEQGQVEQEQVEPEQAPRHASSRPRAKSNKLMNTEHEL